jgi:hypothetical protein
MLSADFLFARDLFMKIEFTVPDRNSPGFLKRMKKAVSFRAVIKGGSTSPEAVDEMVEFLVDYVTEPANREQAKEALWDASLAQFEELLGLFSGGKSEIADPLSSGQ